MIVAADRLLHDEGLRIVDGDSQRTWTLKPADSQPLPHGDYEAALPESLQSQLAMTITDSGALLTANQFSLERNGHIRVRITANRPSVASSRCRCSTSCRVTSGSNYALRFDGIDDYVQLPVMPIAEGDPLTLEAWIIPFARIFEHTDPLK